MTEAFDVPPQPLPDADTMGFWQATAQGQLALCRCTDCRQWLMPPLERCRTCAGLTRFEPVSGQGTLYSFIVQWHRSAPGFGDLVPYVVGLIDLDEQHGVRLPGRVVGIEPDEVECGLRVRAEIVPLPGGDYNVAVFRPVAAT